MSWLDDEVPGTQAVKQELRRVIRRAVARKWLVLGITAAVTGIAVVRQARRQGQYTASVTFRISEIIDREAGQGSRPLRELREYIIESMLTHPRCLEIVKKRKLYPSEMRRDPRLATEALGDDLDISVYRNYFLEESAAERSALLAVTYMAKDPEVADAVVMDVAELVREHQREEGRARAEALSRWANQKVDELRGEWEVLSRRYSQAEAAIMAAAKAGQWAVRQQLRGQASLLKEEVAAARFRLQQTQAVKARGSLWRAIEGKRSGLSFVQIDYEKPEVPTTPKSRRILMLAGLFFVLVLPMVVLSVGVFLPQVFDREDVQRLGLRVLGHVPPCPGWDRGSLRARLRGELWVVGGDTPTITPRG